MNRPAIPSADRPVPAAPTRRVGAGLVDLVWIALPTMLVARLLVNVEHIHPTIGGSTTRVASTPTTDALTLHLGFVNSSLSVGSTGLALTLLALGAAVVSATVVVPSIDPGRTPGMALFGLRIVSVAGCRQPRWHQYLLRTVGAAVDLMPLVAPGLVGFAFAASNRRRQRIGDRLAGTLVVDDRLGRMLNLSGIRSDPQVDTPTPLSVGLAELMLGPFRLTLGGLQAMTSELTGLSNSGSAGPVLDRPPVASRPLFNPYPKPLGPERRRSDAGTGNGSRPDFAAASGAETTRTSASRASVGPNSPEWNDDWNAWIYWDEDRRQWLRFDDESGSWESMM